MGSRPRIPFFAEQVYGTAPAEAPGLWLLKVLMLLEGMGLESGINDESLCFPYYSYVLV